MICSRLYGLIIGLFYFCQLHVGLPQDIAVAPYVSWQLETKQDVTALAISNDQTFIVASDSRGNVQCWDFASKQMIASTRAQNDVLFLDFLSENAAFVIVEKSGSVEVFETQTGNSKLKLKTESRPEAITLDAGKRYLALATAAERIEIFDLQAGTSFGKIDARGKLDHLLFLGFNRLGEQLVAISERAKVACWNPVTQRLIREFALSSDEIHGSKSVIHSAASNRASNIFVVGLQEVALPKGGLKSTARPTDLIRQNMVIAFDWNSGMEIKRLKFPDGAIKNIALGPGSDHVAVTNNRNNNITLIDLRKGELRASVASEEKPLALAVSEDDKWLAAGSEKGQISVWQLQFREKPALATQASSLPSLSGRIRTQSNLGAALQPGVSVVLAIVNFEAKGGVTSKIGDVGLDMLTTSLANFDYITLIEREKIQQILDELKLQSSGLTEKDGARVGKLLNADKVLLCGVSALGANYLFSARVVDVETARVESGRQVMCEECREQDIFDAINLLAGTIAQ